MRIALALTIALACAACGNDVPPEQRAEDDRMLAEQVREANDTLPPLEEVVPEPIQYADMETNDLFGLACSYAPGTSMGARVIARETDAYMKIDGEMLRFAADPGSRELPANSRSFYNGREFTLRLEVAEKEASDDSPFYEGTVWLRDRFDRVVYTGTGAVDCGA
ncbi:hypothetical protein [Aurantiacibacter gangjinensis]|uniref:Uncharacterized protein n=1 Tax=Aurantiacibacter gangjinensis TaxID=502682 RepID=A0A0G9MQ44_9SPHN|nr:hypothetical protein [Aurantiacibacter gangjinensis]APE28687.1 hypothetical protein BMF35_a1858 [Aurantiacibacter gangjinensis]KLE32851.1 hypothetical protein AAW01_02185 [Aurantiacibacter gangjinensis]